MAELNELMDSKQKELDKIKAELNRLEDVKRALLQRGLELQGALGALSELKGPAAPAAPVAPASAPAAPAASAA